MKPIVVMILIPLIAATVGGCAGDTPTGPLPAPSSPPVEQPSRPGAVPVQPVAPPPGTQPTSADHRTHRGVLRGGIVAIGGESTGWILEQCDSVGGTSIEVAAWNVPRRAEALEGRRVVVRGPLKSMRYPERGEVPTIIAEAIDPAD